MKVGSHCGYCLMHRGYNIIRRSTGDEETRVRAVAGLLRLMGDGYTPDTVPSYLGATRCRVLKRLTGCPDPYAELKRESNRKALALLPEVKEYVAGFPEPERLRAALRVSCVGNVIEFDVPGHSSDIDEALKGLDEGFIIDDVDAVEELVGPGVRVLLLTDNAGEIVFDRLVVRELRRLGCRVTVAVKGGPSLNDALMEDAEEVGMTGEADEVITTGVDSIGVNLSETSEEFNGRFRGADLIVAKGMANWETLTEVPAPCPLLYLFRTKCEPVARAVGAPMDRNIAKLVPAGWRL